MTEKIIIDWQTIYKEKPIEEMGWFYPDLDPDLNKVLEEHGINTGNFLYLGTGPGTQAIELANKGFSVTGADISFAAVEKASQLTDKVEFIQDDILN